ncbi:MAG: bifunctional adenosylcobinamide kinase/adenosylcobinamide-phosphate guanylyltransferase [Desulfobacterales bacterium]|nr:bifunctional adenosylcobinamide kinase/adenosylcobinamide-phosphate guanylyltransferase [Desulfobacterales bacterium]
MDKREVHLVLGGCRSGKSSHALALAGARTGEKNIFVATCMPADDEMQARVVRHQQERDPQWQTVEEPLELARVIREYGGADVILVDCLTLWISNLMAGHKDDDKVMEQVRDLGCALDDAACPVFLVSNEVGAGIVPENAMARRFRDLAGFVNQHAAQCARHVTWMVAGIAVEIK